MHAVEFGEFLSEYLPQFLRFKRYLFISFKVAIAIRQANQLQKRDYCYAKRVPASKNIAKSLEIGALRQPIHLEHVV